MKLTPRLKRGIAGGLGLALLAFAFAYRWLGPERLGLSLQPAAPTAALPPMLAPPPLQAPDPAVPPVVPNPLALNEPAAPAPDEGDEADDEARDQAAMAGLSDEAKARIDAALARAAAAREAGNLIDPPEDSALSWYEQALELDPEHRGARRGRRAVLREAVESAAAALDSGDAKPATDLLTGFETLLKDLPTAAELAARVAQQPRVQGLLREGGQRMSRGLRFEPAGSSALDSYRDALALDPRNLAARQGLSEIERVVLEQALAAASEDAFADAERLLALATTIQPGTQAQLEARTRILDLRTRRTDALLARAATALDARNPDGAQVLLTRAEALGADPSRIEALRYRMVNARIYDNYQPGATFSDKLLDRAGSGPELVVLPIGEFQMGSAERERDRKPAEGPQHAVRISRAFALSRTEVTVAQFRRFVRATDYVTEAEKLGSSSRYDEANGRISNDRGVDWRKDYSGARARDEEPVVHVSWNDATAFVKWLSERTGKRYRLPSEAEFEYALRAGGTTRYWWGDGNPTRPIGNFTGDGDRSPSKRAWTRAFPRYNDGYWGPAPVGKFGANSFGLFDMGGNVSEWVEDCWHDSYLRAPADGTAWVNPGCGTRVVRGGSWGSTPAQVRSAHRISAPVDTRSGRVGFRVARDL